MEENELSKKTDLEKLRTRHTAKRKKKRENFMDVFATPSFILPTMSKMLNAFLPPVDISDKWTCKPCDLILFLRKGMLNRAYCPSCKEEMAEERREARPASVVDGKCEDVTVPRLDGAK